MITRKEKKSTIISKEPRCNRKPRKRHHLSWLCLLVLLTIAVSSVPAYAISGKTKCYKITPSLTKEAFSYLDKVYTKTYPSLGMHVKYGSEGDIRNLRTMAKQITKKKKSPSKKAEAVIKWCLANISCSGESSFPADSFYSRNTTIFGFSELTADLLRLNGIPAAVCVGFRDNMKKMKCSQIKGEFPNNSWIFAYLNKKWVMFDPLSSGSKPITKQSYIAKWYYPVRIDGILFSNLKDNLSLLGKDGFVYENGRFMNYNYGEIFPGNSGFVWGGFIYDGAAYHKDCGYQYLDPSRSTAGMKEGELFNAGWFGLEDLTKDYAYENGIQAHGTILTYQNEKYYFNQGSSYKIMAGEGKYWLQNGDFTVAPGFRGYVLFPPDYQVLSKMDSNYSIGFTIESGDTKYASITKAGYFTAKAKGRVSVNYQIYYEGRPESGMGGFSINISDKKPIPSYKTKKLSIASRSNAVIKLKKKTYKYTGSAIKPKITVRRVTLFPIDGKYPVLKKGVDYTVTYKNNKKPGTGTIIIKGKGTFKGKKKLHFKIKR